MEEKTLPPFALPDTLYALCRSVDNRHAPPLPASAIPEIVAQKKTYFSAEAARNPLARAVMAGERIHCDDVNERKRAGFLKGSATFFRVHEVLRSTRHSRTKITLGHHEHDRADVVEMFNRCVPNANLRHVPWCSLGRYTTSLGLAWGITLLAAYLVGRDGDTEHLLDGPVLASLGTVLTLVAFLFTTFTRNRDLRRPAAWNSCLYLDLNADLLRRDLLAVAAARKEFLPRQGLVKSHAFYYPLARRVEAHEFDAELQQQLPAQSLSHAG